MQEELTKEQAVTVTLNHTFAKTKSTAKGSFKNNGKIVIVVPEVTGDHLVDIGFLKDVHKLNVLIKRSGKLISVRLSEREASN